MVPNERQTFIISRDKVNSFEISGWLVGYIWGIEESRGRFQNSQKAFNIFHYANTRCKVSMEGLISIVLNPWTNNLLIPMTASDLTSDSAVIHRKGGHNPILFANFENDPYCLQSNKYTSHPKISKLFTLSPYRMKVGLSFGTKYVRVKINLLRKNPHFFHVQFLSFLSRYIYHGYF